MHSEIWYNSQMRQHLIIDFVTTANIILYNRSSLSFCLDSNTVTAVSVEATGLTWPSKLLFQGNLSSNPLGARLTKICKISSLTKNYIIHFVELYATPECLFKVADYLSALKCFLECRRVLLRHLHSISFREETSTNNPALGKNHEKWTLNES